MDLKFVKLKNPINVSLKDFVLGGKFDCLKLGVSKSWLQYNFFQPDDILVGETFASSAIWRYGNFELHFDGDILHFIFSDYVDELDGGEKIKLDKWILEDRKHAKMKDWVTELNRNIKNFKVHQLPELEQTLLIIEQKNNVIMKLRFISPNEFLEQPDRLDPSEYILGAICLCPKELESF